jgi:hypothetical protein
MRASFVSMQDKKHTDDVKQCSCFYFGTGFEELSTTKPNECRQSFKAAHKVFKNPRTRFRDP